MSLTEAFREFGRIYGICPCCGELFRLSDAHVFAPTRPPKSPFDEVADRWQHFELQVERFETREGRIRAQARLAGQRAARRRLRDIVPFFLKRRVNPNDVKVLFSPLHYVAFRGMTDGECKSVEFIDEPARTKVQGALQESVYRTITAGNLEWCTLRIGEDGIVTMEKPT